MHIRYGYAIEVRADAPTSLLARIDLHPSRRSDITQPEELRIVHQIGLNGAIASETALDSFGNVVRRLTRPAGVTRLEAVGVVHDAGFPDPDLPAVPPCPRGVLPSYVTPYLAASPCADPAAFGPSLLSRLAELRRGAAMVEAACEHVQATVRWHRDLPAELRPLDQVLAQGMGSREDIVHGAIALCRGLGIPARYATGYVCDADCEQATSGFCAWGEVYLDGHWWAFDPSGPARRIGRILVGRGRDASDVPALDTGEPCEVLQFETAADEVGGSRFPLSSRERRQHWTFRSSIAAATGR